METKEILRKIKGVFKLPKKEYYLGKIVHGTPYFNPIGFVSSIIYIRLLEKRSEEDLKDLELRYPHLYPSNEPYYIYRNLPMIRRSKNWIVKLSGLTLYIEVGWPIAINTSELGWKDKFDTPRFEWNPSFQIFFFWWQFCIFRVAPVGKKGYSESLYWEMILWYLYYADEDLDKAEETWGWIDYETKKSTWKKEYLVWQ